MTVLVNYYVYSRARNSLWIINISQIIIAIISLENPISIVSARHIKKYKLRMICKGSVKIIVSKITRSHNKRDPFWLIAIE